MENQETAKMAAKSKMKLSATVLGLLAVFGLAVEYVRKTAPLEEAVVVFVKSKEAADVMPMAETIVEEKPVSEQSGTDVSAAKQATAEKVPGVSVGEFLGYLREVSDKANAVEKPESALGQIILPVPEPQAVSQPVEAFNEQVIEVMDDNGELVEIVEVQPAEEANGIDIAHQAEDNTALKENTDLRAGAANETTDMPIAAEKLQESVSEIEEKPETVVNSEENMFLSDENGPAVDMMKEIIGREQAVSAGKE